MVHKVSKSNYLCAMETIIFDLGVVLLDVDYRRTIDAFAELGLEDPENAFSKHKQDELFRKFERGEIERREFLAELAGRMNIADHHAIEEAWCAMLGELPRKKFNLLEKLGRYYDLFILSNTNEIHQKHFEQTMARQFGPGTFQNLFVFIGYSHKLGSRKPEAKIYDQFIAANSIEVRNTLFIDDTELNVTAALERGIPSIHFKDGDDLEALLSKYL